MNEFPLHHRDADGWSRCGVVTAVSAQSIAVRAPGLTPGAAVSIERASLPPLLAVVISVSQGAAACAPLARSEGVVVGAPARSSLARVGAFVGDALLGCATDPWGRASGITQARVARADPSPLPVSERASVGRYLRTGVGAIDAFAPIAHGQRLALLAGAGVGKTTLLRRIVAGADVDARVIALVGERGREAVELLDEYRRSERWATTTLVCATADALPSERLAAARTATAQAEALAAGGRDVLLVVDSLTRVATAWREIALAAGELPAHRGHPPSLASMLAGLVERAGARRNGSVTGLYSVLVDGDDLSEPVTDSIRALLDGHITLSRSLSDGGRFPAIDVLRSISRLMKDVAAPDHQRNAAEVRSAIDALDRAEDLFAIGAYRPGGDARLDRAVEARDAIEALLFDGIGATARPNPLEALAIIAAQLRSRD